MFNPPIPVAPAVNIFKDLVLSDLAQLPIKKPYSHPSFQAGLKSLSENKDIVIRPADKGGGMVVLDRIDYEREMYRILGDTETYKALLINPTNNFRDKLEDLLEKGYQMNILNKKEILFSTENSHYVFFSQNTQKSHSFPRLPH